LKKREIGKVRGFGAEEGKCGSKRKGEERYSATEGIAGKDSQIKQGLEGRWEKKFLERGNRFRRGIRDQVNPLPGSSEVRKGKSFRRKIRPNILKEITSLYRRGERARGARSIPGKNDHLYRGRNVHREGEKFPDLRGVSRENS